MHERHVTRRSFLAKAAAGGALQAWVLRQAATAAEAKSHPDGGAREEDPVRRRFPGKPDLDQILALYPRTQGPPAFDAQLIAENVRKLKTSPPVDTGHPFLDLSVKTGLAHVEATFRGDHPRYGVGTYAQPMHDGFPPTIIAAVDALSAWGLGRRAAELFRYWLVHFVREDGSINYYGPSIAEYGQLLHTAATLDERAGPEGWWPEGFRPLDRIAEYLLRLRAAAAGPERLISGVPEADTRSDTGRYFHNNGWVVKGLRRWAGLCRRRGVLPATAVSTVGRVAAELAEDTLLAIGRAWPADPADWWLPPRIEPVKRPQRLTAAWDTASYTNYRYWPELLSSGILPPGLANRVVEARLSAGGQFCGMTRFAGVLDDWPLADYLYGLWSLSRKNDFLLSLYGHVAYHQAEGHLTAYESVSLPPGRKVSDYCLPCQLVAARAARLIQR
jgi:hypothetical protein